MGIAILLLLGLACIALGSVPARAWYRTRATKPVRVADIQSGMGNVELVGRVEQLGEVLTEPVSGLDAVASHWKVTYSSSGGEGSSTRKIASGDARQPFVLDDGSGKVLVHPEGAAMNFDYEHWKVGRKDAPPSVIRRFLGEGHATHPAASEELFHCDRTFYSGRLEPAGEVYVHGPVQPGPAEDAVEGTIQPWVGTRHVRQSGEGSKKGSYGLASETDVFTIFNGPKHKAVAAMSGQAVVFIGFGLLCVVLAGVLVFV